MPVEQFGNGSVPLSYGQDHYFGGVGQLSPKPWFLGIIGTAIGNAGVSISNMAVGQSPEGKTALMVLSIDQTVPEATIEALSSSQGILEVHAVEGV